MKYGIIDTNIENVMASGPVNDWLIAIMILAGLVVILIIALVLLMRKISALRNEIKDIKQ